jgi:hypothetical protein
MKEWAPKARMPPEVRVKTAYSLSSRRRRILWIQYAIVKFLLLVTVPIVHRARSMQAITILVKEVCKYSPSMEACADAGVRRISALDVYIRQSYGYVDDRSELLT